MNRILLVGKKGRLGRELLRTLAPLGELNAIDREEVDLLRPSLLRETVKHLRPSLIVNAAAFNDIDKAESSHQDAFSVNRDAPAILAEEASRWGVPLVHFSTDLVFDGALGRAYTEQDLPNPLNIYGRSRLEGERAIESAGGQYLIFRSSWIYSICGNGFVPNVLRWARENEALQGKNHSGLNTLVGFCYWAREKQLLRVVDDQIGSPTWALMLAELASLAIAKAITLGPDWLAANSGLYHLAGSGAASRLQLAQSIMNFHAQATGKKCSDIIPVKMEDFPTLAQRPACSPLNSRRFENTFGFTIPAWQETLRLAIDSSVSRALTQLLERDVRQAEEETQLVRLSQDLAEKNRELTEIYHSKMWRSAMALRYARVRIVPSKSRREKMIRKIYQVFHTWQQKGSKALMRKVRSRLTSSNEYQSWIAENEPSRKTLELQRQTSRASFGRPLISIITPVYNTPVSILEATIQSVISQTSDNWELCIANGSPDNILIRQLLHRYAAKDKRIKIHHLDYNRGIAGNTNAAIDISSGEFVAFLDHDDLLAPFALYTVLDVINQNPLVDMIYSDEDKITANGKERYEPFFKPAFNPDYLRSINYIAHFLVIRRSVGSHVGWFQDGVEGSQDYDLILRVAEKARMIAHCPQILYHWRAIPGSAALASSEKDYATESGIRALKNHLHRMQIEGSVSQAFMPTSYRVSFAFNKSTKVSIVIPSRDHANDLELCVRSILEKSTYKNFEILIIENNSQEESTFALYKNLIKHTNVRLVEYHETPFNYSNINNYAAGHARGNALLFLNNDTEVISPDWLESMVEHICRPAVGIVGAKLYYPDDTIQHGGVVIGIGGIAGHVHKHLPRSFPGSFGRLMLQQNFSAVTAACLMVKRQVFNDIQGFDPKFQLAFGDVDFCLKVRSKGHLVVWTPYAELYHHESKTRGYEDTEEKLQRYYSEYKMFRRKWPEALVTGDEYYNPNLTLDFDDLRLAPVPLHQKSRITTGLLA